MSFIFTMNRFVTISMSWDFLIHVTYKITRFSATFFCVLWDEKQGRSFCDFITGHFYVKFDAEFLRNNRFFELKQENIKSLQKLGHFFSLFDNNRENIEVKILEKTFVRMWQNQQLLVRKMYNTFLSLISDLWKN